jgi:1,4-alpha-glucan branching enzyme
MHELALSPAEMDVLVAGEHGDPFSVLGVQQAGQRYFARAIVPGAETLVAHALGGGAVGALKMVHGGGVFEGRVKLKARVPLRYRAGNAGGEWWVDDPYSFGPVLGPMDDHYIAEGSHLRLFDRLGAHPMHHEGAAGTHFAVWAPNARRVSVVGDFNGWDGRRAGMRCRRDIGVWEIFLPGVRAGQAYKFEIIGADGALLPLKADPFAFRAEMRPATASVVHAAAGREWGDAAHRAFWAQADARAQPIAIYEVHAGSWERGEDGGFLSWDALAERLIPYVVEMGFTHIEFLPITEHPYDPSWGYQTTGLYAPSARFGEPEGFARFVDGAHRAGIGVILDWVPAHFPTDAHGLARFDGTALYEHEDPRQGFHPDWQTAIYNFGRREVAGYLLNNALFWMEKYHLDGLRVDAVASMLYLDYSRDDGAWVPNKDGGNQNLEAVAFLQAANARVHGQHPGVLMIAEESTSWPGVSHPVHAGGLGFGFKWNMGFMHDTLRYLARAPEHRRWHHSEITFGLLYAWSENFVLPLSHDEVVHGKGTMLARMAGDARQKFATLRAYYAFMWGYPGKKLLFMGQEFAQGAEWSEAKALDWWQLGDVRHRGVQSVVRDLNRLYRAEAALHARDCAADGFEWLVVDDAEGSVFAWVRRAPGTADVAVIAHFSDTLREGYRLRLPAGGRWRELLNTDAADYAGEGRGNGGAVYADADGLALMTLPPLSTIILKRETEGRE